MWFLSALVGNAQRICLKFPNETLGPFFTSLNVVKKCGCIVTFPWIIVRDVPQPLVTTKIKLVGRVAMVRLCVVVPAEQGEKDLKPSDTLVTGEFRFATY